jgi:hypothetical protein
MIRVAKVISRWNLGQEDCRRPRGKFIDFWTQDVFAVVDDRRSYQVAFGWEVATCVLRERRYVATRFPMVEVVAVENSRRVLKHLVAITERLRWKFRFNYGLYE